MEKVTYFTDELTGTEFAVVDNGDGSFTSMPKATYDELKANEAKTK